MPNSSFFVLIQKKHFRCYIENIYSCKQCALWEKPVEHLLSYYHTFKFFYSFGLFWGYVGGVKDPHNIMQDYEEIRKL